MIVYQIFMILLLVTGSLLVLLGAVGIVRFPDPLCRSHALGKASSLGVCLMLGGLWMALDNEVAGLRILMVIVFNLLTIPMASHLVALYVYTVEKIDVTLQPDGPDEVDVRVEKPEIRDDEEASASGTGN